MKENRNKDAVHHWLINQGIYGVIITDSELRIQDWNSWMESHTGIMRYDACDRYLFEVFPEIKRSHLDRYYTIALSGIPSFLSQVFHKNLIKLKPKTQNQYFTEMQQIVRIEPIHMDEFISGTITIIEDVTDTRVYENSLRDEYENLRTIQEHLRKSEHLAQSVLSALSEGILIFDKNGKIVKTNEGIKQFFLKNTSLLGQTIYDLNFQLVNEKGESIPLNLCPSELVRNTGKPIVNELYARITPDGKKLWCNINATALNNVENAPPYECVVSLLDLTHMVQIREQLENSNKEKSKLFSIIAHDLKSPFNAILGLSSLMAEQSDNFETGMLRHMAAEINKVSQQHYGLLENLLNWSSFQMNAKPLLLKKSNISLEIKYCLDLVQHSYSKKGITILNLISEGTTCCIDIMAFRSVIQNLISNSIKFTENGGRIVLRENLETKGKCILTIEDSGIGMPSEMIEQILNRSEYETTPGTNGEKGSGLGLEICKLMLEKMNAGFGIESKSGKYTRFIITLNVDCAK